MQMYPGVCCDSGRGVAQFLFGSITVKYLKARSTSSCAPLGLCVKIVYQYHQNTQCRTPFLFVAASGSLLVVFDESAVMF